MAIRKRTRYQIKSYPRFLLSLSVVLIFLLTATVMVAGVDSGKTVEQTGQYVVVQAGDTMWQLARTYGPDTQDARKIIRAICEQNNLKPGQLQPGQSVFIPDTL